MKVPRLAAPAALAAVTLLAALPAVAQDKPVTDRSVSAGDVVTTPVSDLNLKKDEIPAVLLAAQDRPYDLAGLGSCARLAGAVSELDRWLGDDIDLVPAGEGQTSVGRVAQSAVGSLIPFRGLIREISGANAQERKLQLAIFAGGARRAFLKGVGQQRGCRYPARAATPAVIASHAAAQAAKDKAD